MDGDCLLCLPLYEKFVENKDGQLGCNLLVCKLYKVSTLSELIAKHGEPNKANTEWLNLLLSEWLVYFISN